MRLGAPRRGHHVGVGGVGAAVQDVVAHRAVQQRGVLRDHADRRAQTVLRDAGDVLAVDQDAARLQVVKAQQQVDDRALARTRAADQADLLAGAHAQRQVVDDPRALALAVAEVQMRELQLAACHAQRHRIRPVEHGVRPRQRVDAVLHRADLLEQVGHLPHHPVRDAVQAQRHRGGRRHRADADLPLRPQPQRGAGGGQDQPDAAAHG